MNSQRRLAEAIESPILAHQHLFSALNTLIKRKTTKPPIRVLDIGCGDASLMSYLQRAFTDHQPDCRAEIYGFDISEQGYRHPEQMRNAIRLLRDRHPGIDWSRRVGSWCARDEWQYDDGFFDLAVSNHVLEHVPDVAHFLANLKRCLKPGGLSVHLFPLRNHIIEGHTNMPFVHYVRDFEDRVAYASLLNRLGLSRFRSDREILGLDDPVQHARDAAEFVQGFTTYRSFRDFYLECNRNQLSLSHEFTADFYLSKLRRLAKRDPIHSYPKRAVVPLARTILFQFLKHVSSVTLVMESIDYDIANRIRREKIHRARTVPASAVAKAA